MADYRKQDSYDAPPAPYNPPTPQPKPTPLSFLTIFVVSSLVAILGMVAATFTTVQSIENNLNPTPPPTPAPPAPTPSKDSVFSPSAEQRESWNQKCPGANEINCPKDDKDLRKKCIEDAKNGGSAAGFTGTAVNAKTATTKPCNPCRDSQYNKQIVTLTEGGDCFSPAIVDVSEIADTTTPNPAIAIVNVNGVYGPQAGANVTKGYKGDVQVRNANFDGSALRPGQNAIVQPIQTPYSETALCPVNVHWHLGAEHYSQGEYSCNDKCGPTAINSFRANKNKRRLAKADKPLQMGFQCNRYDPTDEKFTKEYNWQFCDAYDATTGKGMQVGQTYEVHWPHSALGSCGTPYQYQYPFPDGVFCNVQSLNTASIDRQALASSIGVQGQVFTIVNDENYYFPNLLGGMIVNKDLGMGQDMTIYTGSTTGQSVNNSNSCSMYNPVTWQVDRKCHLISASSFDKLCADMRAQRDDMSGDITPHGSRALVIDELAADNHQNGFMK